MAKSAVINYETENYTIQISRALCISCGTCVALAPKTFELDKDSISQVKNPPHDKPPTILSAAQSCATDSIIIIEKKSGKKLWPK